MPFALRTIVAMVMWLFIAPLATAYLYQLWIKGFSSAISRASSWTWPLVWSDAISGAVVAVVVVVNFLGIMSFADFLRFNWQLDGGLGGRMGGFQQEEDVDIADEDIDDVIVDQIRFARRQRKLNLQAVGVMDQRRPLFVNSQHTEAAEPVGRRIRWNLDQDNQNQVDGTHGLEEEHDFNAHREELLRRLQTATALQEQLDAFEARFGSDEDTARGVEEDRATPPVAVEREDVALLDDFLVMQEAQQEREEPDAPNVDRFEPQFEPLEPVLNDEDPAVSFGCPIWAWLWQISHHAIKDMELNIGLDELLGLRGPFGALIRNVLLLLLFNLAYLGLFARIPMWIGATTYRFLANKTAVTHTVNYVPGFNATTSTELGLIQLVQMLNGETVKLNKLVQVDDVLTIGLGYCTIAVIILGLNWAVSTWGGRAVHTNNTDNNEGGGALPNRQNIQPHRPQDAFANDEMLMGMERPDAQLNQDEILIASVSEALAQALACVAAVVKVGMLLFLKMLFLPLVLGICLDVVTLPLFESSVHERIAHSGRDLLSSALLHWVVGITFMLLVTVSVLQLREVVHPELLARIVRPQEPQPDLLGNLLNENGATHAKRMVLSLSIYAFLLGVHVWLPSQLLVASGLSRALPFLRFRFCHIVNPQLQVPVELLFFHLTMLGFLEKYKNNIGEMQHRWLAWLCGHLGLDDQVLPKSVNHFVLLGWKPIFVTHDEGSPIEADEDAESNATPGLTAATQGSVASLGDTGSLYDALYSEKRSPSFPAQALRQLRAVDQVDPFWYELAARTKNAEEFIVANMERSSSATPQIDQGKSLPDGSRVLSGAKAFIRLPLSAAQQDVADRIKRRQTVHPSALKEVDNLIQTTRGDVRLRRNERPDGTIVIEFWREVQGDLISRPPEGWDDLGAGGAEVQGRWAWAKERKSTIERGVACRSVFFRPGMDVASSIGVSCRLVLLAVLSWLAVATAVCAALSIPLVLGRGVMLLMRVPLEYNHDPFSFAIGVLISCQILASVSCSLGNDEPLFGQVRHWIARTRIPPKSKLFVVALAAFYWVILAPLVLAMAYELAVTTKLWFVGEESFRPGSILFSWATGSLLLNSWAYLAYCNAFTKEFWIDVGNAALDVDANQAQHAAAANRDAQPPHPTAPLIPWQGGNGRIAGFAATIKVVLFDWEWDRVDQRTLLTDCAQMVVVQIAKTVVMPFAFVSLVYVALGTEGLAAWWSILLFRMLLLSAATTNYLLSYQEQLQSWYEVAHKAARDDRYLIGEVLLDYSPARE